jgi:heme/copper-type cytochrome/quinol oxidase subunit 1
MPRLSVWFITAAITQFALGALIGAVMMIARALDAYPAVSWLLPFHIEFMLIGWEVQLAMGVAYWVLPRYRTGPERGSERLTMIAFALVNVGVLLASLAGIDGFSRWATAGHVLEILGGLAFGINVWHRLPRSIAPRGRSLPIITL